MRALLLAIITCTTLALKTQTWEWVKPFEAGISGPGEKSVFTDPDGNVYFRGEVAHNTTQFIAKYSPSGEFRWIHEVPNLVAADMDPWGHLWYATADYLACIDANKNTVLKMPVSYTIRRLTAHAQGCAAIVDGGIAMYDQSGNTIVERTGLGAQRILKVENNLVYVLGSYFGSQPAIDGHTLTPAVYMAANYYGIFDSHLHAINVSTTSGGYMSDLDAATVLSSGEFINASSQRYDAASLYFNSSGNTLLWKKKLVHHLSNFVTGVCEYGDAILALHMSTGGGPGFSASLHAFDRAGDSITSKTWEGIHGLDMSVTSQGIYIVGNAQDTTELDGHVVHPYDVWLGKLRYDTPITGSPENNTTLPAAYPNPFHDRCEIAVSGVTGDSVLLTDVQGKVFTPTFSVTGEKLTIIRENLASGIYLCRFRTEYGWKSVKLAIF